MPRQKKQHLKQRKDGRYCCKYKGKQFLGYTEEEALAAREEYKNAEKRGIALGNSITVNEYARNWLPVARPNISRTTYNGLAIHLDKLCKQVGNLRVMDVKPSMIKKVYSEEYRGLSDSYIKSGKQLFCALFEAAAADGLCQRNPAKERAASPHKGTFGGHRAITDQERRWILTLCTDHRAWPAVMAMLYAGLRPAEAKALNLDNALDLDAGVLRLSEFVHYDKPNHYAITKKGKTAKSAREIPLFAPLRAALKGKSGLLVASSSGKPVTIQAWKVLWNSYVFSMETAINGVQKRWYGKTKEHKAMIERGEALPPWVNFTVRPYDLRHSFATWCRDNGVELNTLVQWMGHVDATMVLRIYDEVTDQRSKMEAEKLEKKLIRMQNGMQSNDEGS